MAARIVLRFETLFVCHPRNKAAAAAEMVHRLKLNCLFLFLPFPSLSLSLSLFATLLLSCCCVVALIRFAKLSATYSIYSDRGRQREKKKDVEEEGGGGGSRTTKYMLPGGKCCFLYKIRDIFFFCNSVDFHHNLV